MRKPANPSFFQRLPYRPYLYSNTTHKEHLYKMDWRAFSSLIKMLFDEGAEKALEWVEEQTAGAALEDEIPFAGWIMLVINIATTLAQLAETIVEVATSPWMITNKIATAITSTLT